IKKDRDEGFKGALHIDHDDNWLEGVNGAYVDGHYFSICVSATGDADRRRLIRLPELEEAYIAAIEAEEDRLNRQYYIGPLTMQKVFQAHQHVNMHDMQAVLDAVEAALHRAQGGNQ